VKTPLKIFVSYRQTDTGPEVRTLSDYLKEAFGRTMVFVDTANVRHGPKWPPQIQQALEAAGVLIVAVGPKWFNEENQRRLNEEGDWVRLEIARSLERDIRIIPLLVNGAQRPNPGLLPSSIADLGKHLPMPLARENWAGQVRDLIDELVAVGCRRLPMRIILMDSHTKIYGRKKNRIPEEMNSHVIRRQLESLPGQTIEIEPVNSSWRGEVGIAARNPGLIIIHYSCLDEGRKAPQRLEQFLERILGDCPDVEVIVYSRTTHDRSAKFEDEFDEDIKQLVSSRFMDRVHGLPVFRPKPRRGQKSLAQTFDDPATARALRKLVTEVLAIDN
jgi:hypothetical protein